VTEILYYFHYNMGNSAGVIKEKLSWSGAFLGLGALLVLAAGCYCRQNKSVEKVTILDTIGNTPLVYLPALSQAAGAHIFVTDARCR
jgi:hypothetical protein